MGKFISAKQWREMDIRDMLESLDIAVKVLTERRGDLNIENIYWILEIIRDLTSLAIAGLDEQID